MDRRSFLGAAAAALLPLPALGSGALRPPPPVGDKKGAFRTLALFEQLDWERPFVDIPMDMVGKGCVTPDRAIYSVAGCTLTRHNDPADAFARVVLTVRLAEGGTRQAAWAALHERLGREAVLLTKHAPAGRKLWLRPAAGATVFFSKPRGVWKAWVRSALVVVPEYI